MKLFLLLGLLLPFFAHAGVEQLPEEEFRRLAADLAPKVNLFRDVWAVDPKAEFYGGTSRDFLYWIKGHFKDARTKEEAKRIADELRRAEAIDVRDFIIGDSDVDVIASRAPSVNVENYGIKKLDSISTDVIDPATERGLTEINQGYIPAEKVRLARDGVHTSPALGDGLKEIYEGKLSIHFAPPELFAKTHYASQGLNHPILLATRYLRLQAINYFRSHGRGVPDRRSLLAAIPEDTRRALHAVINETLDGRTLQPYLEKAQFKKWLNGNIQKAFRSYTNPTAALELMREFKVDKLVGTYDGLDTVNNYVFAKHRDPVAVAENFSKVGVKPGDVFRDPSAVFPDLRLYHGTKDDADFRAILLQGILPSSSGSADGGLYGVSLPDRAFAETWGGDPKRLVGFPVKPEAKIVDITEGPGEALFRKFGGTLDEFAEAFGVDIIRYPYASTRAYVVKNSEALGRAFGVNQEVMSFARALERARNLHTNEELARFGQDLTLSRFTVEEMQNVLRGAYSPRWASAFRTPRLSEGTLRLEPRFETEGPFAKALRQVYAPTAMKEVLRELKDQGDAAKWLAMLLSVYAQDVKPKTYGGMNVTVPSLDVAQAAADPIPFAAVEEALRGLDQLHLSPAPAVADSYDSLKEMARFANQLRAMEAAEHGASATPARVEWVHERLESLRASVAEGLARVPATNDRAQAEKWVLAHWRDDLFFVPPDEMLAQLTYLTAHSSLPEAEKTALVQRMVNAPMDSAERFLGQALETGENQVRRRGLASFGPLQEFFRSPVLRDYPGLALAPLRSTESVQLKGYSSIYDRWAMKKLANSLAQSARDLDGGGFLRKAIESPGLSGEEWENLASKSTHYTDENRLIARLADSFPDRFRLPEHGLNAILFHPPQEYSRISPAAARLYVESVIHDPRFLTHPKAGDWLWSVLSNKYLADSAAWKNSLDRTLPVVMQVIEHDQEANKVLMAERLKKMVPAERVPEVEAMIAHMGLPARPTANGNIKDACREWFGRVFR